MCEHAESEPLQVAPGRREETSDPTVRHSLGVGAGVVLGLARSFLLISRAGAD